jgi:hypothetical protein
MLIKHVEKTTLLPCLKQVMLLTDQTKEQTWKH